jgi:hypothetical protein
VPYQRHKSRLASRQEMPLRWLAGAALVGLAARVGGAREIGGRGCVARQVVVGDVDALVVAPLVCSACTARTARSASVSGGWTMERGHSLRASTTLSSAAYTVIATLREIQPSSTSTVANAP